MQGLASFVIVYLLVAQRIVQLTTNEKVASSNLAKETILGDL